MIEFTILVVVGILSIAINTGILAGALLLTGEEAITKESVLKCLGVTTVAFAIAFIPVLGLISGLAPTAYRSSWLAPFAA